MSVRLLSVPLTGYFLEHSILVSYFVVQTEPKILWLVGCKSHLSLIKATQNKQDVGAETLSDLSLITEQAGQAINKQAVGQKFSNAHQA